MYKSIKSSIEWTMALLRKPSDETDDESSVETLGDLRMEKNRLRTFDEWSGLSTFKVNKHILACSGFYLVRPQADLVKCYFCNVMIGMWQNDDNVVEEHVRWSTYCPLMHGHPTANVPICEDALQRILPKLPARCPIPRLDTAEKPIDQARPPMTAVQSPSVARRHYGNAFNINRCEHPEYATLGSRLSSFSDWPKAMPIRVSDLADAGFYYTGRGDRVACFACGNGLCDWSPNDSPWEQHAMWYPSCEFLKLAKGKDFIDKAKLLVDINAPPSSDCEDIAVEPSFNMPGTIECKICLSEDISTVFHPCMHALCCVNCATSIETCPLCRAVIYKIDRMFLN